MPARSDLIARNNVRFAGRGRQPMLLAHGFGCDQAMWRFMVPEFEATHRLVLFDHVGSGGSTLEAYSTAKYSSLQGYANDVVELCRTLELNDVIFVGHSVSAMIGALASIKAPELFHSLVMVAPSACYMNKEDYYGGFEPHEIEEMLVVLDSNYLGWSAAMAPAIMGNPNRPELADELSSSFCRNDPAIARHFARVTFTADNRADLPKITTPTLVLQCSDDSIAPEAVGRYVHEHVGDSRFVKLEASGHCPNLSAPAETAEAIKLFLNGMR